MGPWHVLYPASAEHDQLHTAQVCRLAGSELSDDQQLSFAKLRRGAGLPALALEGGPSLPAAWQPSPALATALDRLHRVADGLPTRDLRTAPEDDDWLALALAVDLIDNTTLNSLKLCNFSPSALGLWGLASVLATSPVLSTFE